MAMCNVHVVIFYSYSVSAGHTLVLSSKKFGRNGRKEEARLEQSYLRFSLEESIWFKKGQEVAEFLSISLDPVISVDEYEHYITIRGALELRGEYRMVDGEGEELDAADFSAHRLIQRVTTREDGVSELFHRFPVDITIPKSRILNLEEVYVTVESFDYDLGEDGRLSLVADISISGITEQSLSEEEMDHKESWFEPFAAVARKEVYEQESEEDIGEGTVTEAAENEPEIVQRSENDELFAAHVEKAEFLKSEEETVENEPIAQRNENNESLIAYEAEAVHENEAKVFIGTAKQKETDQAAEENVEPRKENALYLTKLFSKEQEEDFLRLKICIVQQGDSMAKIAKRYDLTVQQILRANHLEHEMEIHEGQLLYIPVPAGSRS